jgi:carbonic anhydrase
MASYNRVSNTSFIRTPSTYEAVVTSGGLISVWDENADLKTYGLKSFRFHAPSEHTVNEDHYDLEL